MLFRSQEEALYKGISPITDSKDYNRQPSDEYAIRPPVSSKGQSRIPEYNKSKSLRYNEDKIGIPGLYEEYKHSNLYSPDEPERISRIKLKEDELKDDPGIAERMKKEYVGISDRKLDKNPYIPERRLQESDIYKGRWTIENLKHWFSILLGLPTEKPNITECNKSKIEENALSEFHEKTIANIINRNIEFERVIKNIKINDIVEVVDWGGIVFNLLLGLIIGSMIGYIMELKRKYYSSL